MAVSRLVPCCTSKTVPRLEAPPASVVPNRLPPPSRVNPATGLAPSVPLKLARVTPEPPAGNSKTVPCAAAPPAEVVYVDLAGRQAFSAVQVQRCGLIVDLRSPR